MHTPVRSDEMSEMGEVDESKTDHMYPLNIKNKREKKKLNIFVRMCHLWS